MESEKSSIYEKLNYKRCIEIFQKLDSMENSKQLFMKCAKQSTICRKEGNTLYKQSPHDSDSHKLIWTKYLDSIVKAPSGSHELALAYAARANILLHMRIYRHCLKDVESALTITKSYILKVRLFCYKAKCSVALRLGIESNALQKATFFLNKIKTDGIRENNKGMKELTSIVRETTLFVEKCEDDIQRKCKKEKAYRISSTVEIKHNRKYGRHLVATRDINPGEKVLVEKIYACIADFGTAHCTHCLGVSWSFIPCDYCNWVLFCSEKCKRKAWEKYHEMECLVFPYISAVNPINDVIISISLRITLMALKECGSIEKLRKELNSVDDCIDQSTKGTLFGRFFCNDSFKSIYSLSNNCPADIYEILGYETAVTLYALAKYSKVFGKDFTFTDNKDLRKNKDVIFIGALILRFSAIVGANMKSLVGLDCSLDKNTGLETRVMSKRLRGTYIAPLSSLINHSCNPNVYLLHTDDGKVVHYCVLPIKKNSQIFTCYYQPFYLNPSKNDRQRHLMENHMFKCKCEACENNWHSIPKSHVKHQIKELLLEKYKHDKVIGPIFENLLVSLHCLEESEDPRIIASRTKFLRCIGKDMKQLMEHLSFPSLEILIFVNSLRMGFEKLYGTVSLHAPDTCTKL